MDILALNEKFKNCSCGREHTCPIDHIRIGKGVIGDIAELCRDYNSIMLVSDANTYRVCGSDVASILGKKVKVNHILTPNPDIVVPNEEKVNELEDVLPEDTDLIVGVGSGVINDLCKYVSFQRNLPYYIVATAPSMDGYASAGAAMILDGMKVTPGARPPKAIIADSRVMKDAPMDMIKSGYGDILGKFSCLNDWKLSHIVNGEYFCKEIWNLTYDMLLKTKDIGSMLLQRNEDAVITLMEALVGVGVAMAYCGTSRPASGSEHHLSHYFEITGLIKNEPYFLHGIDVAYSAVYTQKLREELLTLEMPGNTYRMSRDKYEAKIREIYTKAADSVIALQDKLGWYSEDKGEVYRQKWTQIRQTLAEVPSADELTAYLKTVEMDTEEFTHMYSEKKIRDALFFAKDLKDRYSVLWMYFDLFGGKYHE